MPKVKGGLTHFCYCNGPPANMNGILHNRGKMEIDVKTLKAALEDAKFIDPALRELVYETINELDADLDDAEYQPSEKVIAKFDELETYLTEHEDDSEEEPLVTEEDRTLADSIADDEDNSDDEEEDDDVEDDDDSYVEEEDDDIEDVRPK